jgi:hypothetical protein
VALKARPLVVAQQIGSAEDLHNCLVLFSFRLQNSLDSKLCRSDDANAVQQFPQSAGGNQGFIFACLDLICDVVLFLLLEITQRSVVLIIFIFRLLATLFLLLVLFLLMVIIVVVVLWQLLSFLRVFCHKCRDHYLKVVLLPRNVLRRVGLRLRLQLRWHIPLCQLTNEQTSSALAGCAASMDHLQFWK